MIGQRSQINAPGLRAITGKARFGIMPSLRHRCLVLMLVRETGLQNIVWVNVLTLKLGWPPFRLAKGWAEV